MKYIVHFVDKTLILACFEWVDSCEHLVEDEAKAIPVNRGAILFVTDDLWRKILRRTTETLSPIVVALKASLR